MVGTQEIRYFQVGSYAVGNRLLDPEQRTVQSDPTRANALTCGHRACQGCGEALTLATWWTPRCAPPRGNWSR